MRSTHVRALRRRTRMRSALEEQFNRPALSSDVGAQCSRGIIRQVWCMVRRRRHGLLESPRRWQAPCRRIHLRWAAPSPRPSCPCQMFGVRCSMWSGERIDGRFCRRHQLTAQFSSTGTPSSLRIEHSPRSSAYGVVLVPVESWMPPG